ncbi:MAG: PrsW family intramembrane metalloprotease [Myxococcales bacterium]|nr:PrsW family intramembrane metalloprotease [Myxococcales bacterium]
MSRGAIVALTFVASLGPVLVGYLATIRLRIAAESVGVRVPASRWLYAASIIVGCIGGLVFGLVFPAEYDRSALRHLLGGELLSTALATPISEELGKGALLLGLYATLQVKTPANGLVLGLAAGSGFAAIENLLYGVNAYATGGVDAWLAALRIRLAYGTLIHLSASGLFGYLLGVAQGSRRLGWVLAGPVVATGVAVAIHGGWNLCLYWAGQGDARWAVGSQGVAVVGLTLLIVSLVTQRRALLARSGSPLPWEGGVRG